MPRLNVLGAFNRLCEVRTDKQENVRKATKYNKSRHPSKGIVRSVVTRNSIGDNDHDDHQSFWHFPLSIANNKLSAFRKNHQPILIRKYNRLNINRPTYEAKVSK